MDRKPIRTRRKAFKVGPLPADAINKALGTELDAADVWVSKACHTHIAEDHPDDHGVIMANIVDILSTPTYAGQDPKNGSGFYLVKRIDPDHDDGHFALVAIALELSKHGTYNVKSAYTIKKDDVDSRRLKAAMKVHY